MLWQKILSPYKFSPASILKLIIKLEVTPKMAWANLLLVGIFSKIYFKAKVNLLFFYIWWGKKELDKTSIISQNFILGTNKFFKNISMNTEIKSLYF